MMEYVYSWFEGNNFFTFVFAPIVIMLIVYYVCKRYNFTLIPDEWRKKS